MSLLGEGAMGQVYLARHKELGRIEAIKVLKPQVALDERFVARFRREARATNRLQHTNIVAMHDFGRLPDGRFYLSMEFADGESLSTTMTEEGPFPFARALRILMQLTAAVEHAHSRGVVHRDLKPANIMLVKHRGVGDLLKILDFGISKIISPDYNESILVSQDGIVFGTPLYMAPEQFYRQPNDPRSDIYAIGCVGYELVTGSPPFTGKIPEVVRAHVEKPPPYPSTDAPLGDVPPEFDHVITHCMEKAPGQRYQSAGELLRDLVQLEPTFLGGQRLDDGTLVPELGGGRFDASLDGATLAVTTQIAEPLLESYTDLVLGADETAQAERDEALRELVECLLDHGANDARLTIGLADLDGIDHDIVQCDTRVHELRGREARVEQSTREREGRLRFAIGELIFDRDQGAHERRADLDFQIRELEQRLGEAVRETEAELVRIGDETIAQVAERANLEERRRALLTQLETIVEELVPHFDDNLAVAPYLDRFFSIRDRADARHL
ncbi:serine/threonine-protein kinase [Haliangium ochraceum]|nr:serine/threonine-protein kinase [Haliangium ochraceum]